MFSIVGRMIKDVLTVQVSTVISKCAFNIGKQIIDDHRFSLDVKMVQTLMCLRDWEWCRRGSNYWML